MTAVRIGPQPESYESTLTTKHLHLHMQLSVNNLPTVVTWQCTGWELNRGPFGLVSSALTAEPPNQTAGANRTEKSTARCTSVQIV